MFGSHLRRQNSVLTHEHGIHDSAHTQLKLGFDKSEYDVDYLLPEWIELAQDVQWKECNEIIDFEQGNFQLRSQPAS